MLMGSKLCGKCRNVKEASKFHKRAASFDGLAARCKECQADYDRARLYKPDRVESRMLYRKSGAGELLVQAGQERWETRNGEKRKAHTAVGNAVRDGVLIKQPCEVCGEAEDIHAHHDDYSKPLEVRWLCNKHHIEHHMKERELIREERKKLAA
jgi:hypothetical protein